MATTRSLQQDDETYDGGCACGSARYRIHRTPMFVHCCHCTRCQRETGGPFAHHAMVPWDELSLENGDIEYVKVPADSGTTHYVIRCAKCKTAIWNEWGSRSAITRYVRVGTLDAPTRLPPLAHIYVRSKQPWVMLGDETPKFEEYYDAKKTWPAESLRRYEAAKTEKAKR